MQLAVIDSNSSAMLSTFAAARPSFDFGFEAAAAYGRIRAELETTGNLIGPNDMLIAAHAVALDVVLVTDNVREMSRVRGLVVLSWR
jgi:tRNA(fMet)-specific endonuclease VapC